MEGRKEGRKAGMKEMSNTRKGGGGGGCVGRVGKKRA